MLTMTAAASSTSQQELPLFAEIETATPKTATPETATPAGRGGKRPGAGRKRRLARPNVAHRARPVHKARFPVLVTLRAMRGLPSFRQQLVLKTVKELLLAQQHRVGTAFRVPHFSIQTNHLHLIVEAEQGSL